MAGLVPAIHFFDPQLENSWMAGTTPGHDASLVVAIIKVIRPEAKLADRSARRSPSTSDRPHKA
ncbi:MAG: hypothetical protein WAN73_04965, partial [Methyloceanibacter sp.]